jgi:lysophospholipase
MDALGRGDDYVMGAGPYDPDLTIEGSDANPLSRITHSRDRYQAIMDVGAHHPELEVAGTTNHFLREALRSTRTAREHAGDLVTPTLLLQPTEDSIVFRKGQDRDCAMFHDCRVVRFEGAYHELFQETDDVRDEAMRTVLAFFAAHR